MADCNIAHVLTNRNAIVILMRGRILEKIQKVVHWRNFFKHFFLCINL